MFGNLHRQEEKKNTKNLATAHKTQPQDTPQSFTHALTPEVRPVLVHPPEVASIAVVCRKTCTEIPICTAQKPADNRFSPGHQLEVPESGEQSAGRRKNRKENSTSAFPGGEKRKRYRFSSERREHRRKRERE